ncbi:hypothetical protein [Alicyclobacillus fructus]|nr:hypothetical protein [Alicyclobacillus fructus]
MHKLVWPLFGVLYTLASAVALAWLIRHEIRRRADLSRRGGSAE